MNKGKITISRPSRGDGVQVISIQITDDLSRARFLDIEIGLQEFAECVTGLSSVPMRFTARALDLVGLQRETINASLTLSEDEFARKTGGASIYAKEPFEDILRLPEYQLLGWTNNTYVGSQNSIIRKDKSVTINFSRSRYLKPTENKESAE